jgi:molybdopterin/thiamine biosynthesis adenylyltransferase
MMVESAYRLIVGELDIDGPVLPSAHQVSIGQSARGSTFRFLVTQLADERLKSMEPGQSLEIAVAEKFAARTITTTITAIDGVPNFRAWPSGIRETTKKGYAVRLPSGMSMPAGTQDGIAKVLDALGLVTIREQLQAVGGDLDLVLASDREIFHYYAFDSAEKRQFGRSQTLSVGNLGNRLPEEYALLSDKRVGIVGCGSLGSKVAAMLARSGVNRFTLVDDDLLFAANLVRNELAASAVGAHKVDALRTRLIAIAGKIDITVRRVALGGQESADSIDSVMSDLRECDVIVDTTADAHCFNFSAAVAKAGLKPFVWGEVFAGGIGGLVARVRSGREPEPQTARNQITAWCDAHGIPAPPAGPPGSYLGIGTDAVPLVADDADVSIMAGYLARFVTDCLTRPTESAFPLSAYAIGLRKGWIFSEPYETWPVELVGSDPWKVEQDSSSAADSLTLLRELLPSAFDDHHQSPE